jgi:hypothetical protein
MEMIIGLHSPERLSGHTHRPEAANTLLNMERKVAASLQQLSRKEPARCLYRQHIDFKLPFPRDG